MKNLAWPEAPRRLTLNFSSLWRKTSVFNSAALLWKIQSLLLWGKTLTRHIGTSLRFKNKQRSRANFPPAPLHFRQRRVQVRDTVRNTTRTDMAKRRRFLVRDHYGWRVMRSAGQGSLQGSLQGRSACWEPLAIAALAGWHVDSTRTNQKGRPPRLHLVRSDD